jgi:hypothetical protein
MKKAPGGAFYRQKGIVAYAASVTSCSFISHIDSAPSTMASQQRVFWLDSSLLPDE